MSELKVTRELRVDDVWAYKGTDMRIVAVHTCCETGVRHVEIKCAFGDVSTLSGVRSRWIPSSYVEVGTFVKGCSFHIGRFVTTERTFLGIRLQPKVTFVRDT